jgi:uncharacterized protein YdaU (DUF1376 family)
MNYYKRHIGDYAKKAGHLSTLEHGVYTLLLDAYYDRELAPTKAEAMRQARARSSEEVAAVEAVLTDFFTLRDGRYIQQRVEEEFVKAEEAARRNAENGKRGGRPRKPKGNRHETQSVSEGNPNLSEKNPNPLIHQSTKKEQEHMQPGGCPHDAIVALYHELLPANPRIKAWTGKRQMNLRTRWREDPKRQSLDYWRRFFGHVAASPFLTGRAEGRDGRTFLPGLDWLVMPENFAKVIEGRYHDKGAQA